ncbi:hypothetical protein DFH29DRAFT_949818 [Suillus ampliporus]|nr:hypothetical protein DFH29DRAFT_949818 [Suillus ampliporus]
MHAACAEYLSDTDIAEATSLQTYTVPSMATFWWTFLLGSRWTKVKGLYIITRFMPFLVLATNLYHRQKCQTLINMDLSFGLISATCSEVFFVLRTYVLWNNNRFVLAAMLTGFLVSSMPSLYPKLVLDASARVSSQDPLVLALRLMPPHHVRTLLLVGVLTAFTNRLSAFTDTSAVTGITGCSSSTNLYIPFILLFALQLAWRMASGPMYTALIKHNIFYYACGLFFSAVNVLTSLLLEVRNPLKLCITD